MKKLIGFLLLGSLLSFAIGTTQAQSVVAPINLTWTNPTLTNGGLPLTGTLAITEYRIYVSTSPILAPFATPTLVITGQTGTATTTFTAPNGSTLYIRMSPCNMPAAVTQCSALSNEATKPVNFGTIPGTVTNVQFTVTVTP